MQKTKYLVVGLENSTTKIVTKILAENLGIDTSDFDGHKSVENERCFVQHWSMPYGPRENFPEVRESDWKSIVIVTRDFHCSLKSKTASHQPNYKLAEKEHRKGIDVLKSILYFKNVFLFSYETWFLLEEDYIKKILSDMGITSNKTFKANDVNKKYLVHTMI